MGKTVGQKTESGQTDKGSMTTHAMAGVDINSDWCKLKLQLGILQSITVYSITEIQNLRNV